MIEVDLLDPDLHASGRALDALDDARAVAPIAWTRGRRGRGYWSVTGLRELTLVARDPETFTSWWGTRPEVRRPEGAFRPLHNLDPPDHGIVRRIAETALAETPFPSARPRVRAFVEGGGGDVVRDLASPLVRDLFGAWLGVDADELAARVSAVHEAGAALLDVASDDASREPLVESARRATEEATSFFARSVANAERGPLAVIRREARSEVEGVALAALFAEAGFPTLSDAVGSVAFDLATHPDLARGPLLVDELLRRASPIVQFARRATRDVEFEGAQIASGDQLVLWFLAANHDPRSFAAPRVLVADRAPNPHVAFGWGAHRCIGSRIARTVITELVDEWRGPFAVIEPPVRRRSSYLRGYAKLVLSSAR